MVFNTKARFLEKVNVQNDDACWEWIATKNKRGYGSFWHKTRMIGAHRASYLLFRGNIPNGMHVLHKCDNPSCVNPNHLYLGSHQDNMTDKKLRGRGIGKGGSNTPKPWASRPGEDNPNSKITQAQVQEIRTLYKTGKYTQADLAGMFGVRPPTIHKIVNNMRWTKG